MEGEGGGGEGGVALESVGGGREGRGGSEELGWNGEREGEGGGEGEGEGGGEGREVREELGVKGEGSKAWTGEGGVEKEGEGGGEGKEEDGREEEGKVAWWERAMEGEGGDWSMSSSFS